MIRLLDAVPEAFVSDTSVSRSVSRAVKMGRLRKLASRLYTRNLTGSPTVIVRRNLWNIAGGYFPGAVIADRTALENAPASDGSVLLISERGRDVALPGYILRPRRGAMHLSSDRPFVGSLYLCSTARAYVENMRPTRARNGMVRRSLTRAQIEGRLRTLIRESGEVAVAKLRDDIAGVGEELGLTAEAAALDALIATLLKTSRVRMTIPAAMARQHRQPFETRCVELLEDLRTALRATTLPACLSEIRHAQGHEMRAFFEAYFSNVIEGKDVAIQTASHLIFNNQIPLDAPKDALDVLGTWKVVSDDVEMSRRPAAAQGFVELLRERHRSLLSSRRETRPGLLKVNRNQVGGKAFVSPELVAGTLEHGHSLYQSLETPFQRAVFMMFLVTEVHPFDDGNGRLARVMMNAELAAAGEERIIIPTVYRGSYLSALKALTNLSSPEPLIRVLHFAQRWTAAIHWRDLDSTTREIQGCDGFLDPAAAESEGRRLRMPSG